MSAPMDGSFYTNDMDNYSLTHYTDYPEKPPYDNSYNNVDPRLLSSPQNAPPVLNNDPALSPFDYNIFSPHSNHPFFPDQQQPFQSFEPMRHQMLGHRRSVSVPPEDMMSECVQPPPAMVFHRGGTPLGDQMATGKARGSNSKKWLKKHGLQKKQIQRHAPYLSLSSESIPRSNTPVFPPYQLVQNMGPTSAPQQMRYAVAPQAVMRNLDMTTTRTLLEYPDDLSRIGATSVNGHLDGPNTLRDLDALASGQRKELDSVALGILGFAERISKDCYALTSFVEWTFKDGEEDEVARIRQEKRAINHKATTLEDGLEMLPLQDGQAEEEANVPVTGQDVRNLDAEQTNALLKVYGISHTSDMFLHDKKLAYLRFVGASRVLMHLILD
ncbi:hypothetical protein E4T42_08801 [Aureobasidium subglaciale]|nr:hypothetical protein E4T42_08801 [Aureobasidium subglaciale]